MADTNTMRAEESSLSSWAGPYVTETLGRGQALASMPYQAYMGPLTAGQSDLQTQAFSGLANLTIPTAQQTTYNPASFTAPGTAQDFMSPYISAALEPQMAEAARQADILRVQNAGRLGRAGAYGGGRQAIMEAEGQRNLTRNLADIYGEGMQTAYTQGMGQFNEEQRRQMDAAQQAQRYGLDVLREQQTAGSTQRAIEGEGIAADIAQFEQERDFPQNQVLFMQSLLKGLPLETQSYSYYEPTGLESLSGGAAAIKSTLDALNEYFGGTNTFTGGQASQDDLDAIASGNY